MKAYFYLFEDYIEFIFALGRQFAKRDTSFEIIGLAARRKTVCSKLDKEPNFPLKHYDWLGCLEHKWLSIPLDINKLKYYEMLIGTRNMRHLITCDRELGWGFMTGGIYAQTKLRKLTNHNDDLRWRYIVGMLDYYHSTFIKEQPDFIFFNEFTMAYEMGAYFIAQALNIPIFCISYSRFGEVYIIDDNPYNLFTPAARLFEQAKKDPSLINVKYLQQAEDYIKKFQNSPTLPVYSEIFKQKAYSQASVPSFFMNVLRDAFRWGAIILGLKGTKGFLRQRSGWNILKDNISIFIQTRKVLSGFGFEKPNLYLTEDYFYFPLHVEPEASTMVFADKLTNQLVIIEQIAKSMPVGYKLLVKEHIPMLGLRPRGFYERIRNIPDVHLITPFADNFSLIKNAQLVVTITGTAAWEAMLLGRPALVMGPTQFNIINEGFVYTNDLFSLEEVFQAAVAVKPASFQNLSLLVAATLQEGVELPIESFAYVHYGKNGKKEMEKQQDKISKVAEYLLKALDRAHKGQS